jgi:hypothetical protein
LLQRRNYFSGAIFARVTHITLEPGGCRRERG